MQNLINTLQDVKPILREMFEQKLTRFSQIPESTNTLQLFANAIYKRGIISSLNLFTLSNAYTRPEITFLNQEDYKEFSQIFLEEENFFIIDKDFYDLNKRYFEFLKRENVYFLDAKEEHKSLDTAIDILKSISMNSNNPHTIIGIGGGLTLDVSGFVASLLQSTLMLLPTTLLAAIDATSGGKTGVNFEGYGKNQIGSFYFAQNIFIFKDFFHTLPQKEIVSGLCEMLKHSWLAGDFHDHKSIFNEIFLNGIKNIKGLDALILNNLDLKLKVVEKDIFEMKNIRAILNFGHTMGHAIEMLSHRINESVPHGIAVAHGMTWCLNQFYDCSTINEAEFKEFLNTIIKKYPVREYSKNQILKYLITDKKNIFSNQVNFILPAYGSLSDIIVINS